MFREGQTSNWDLRLRLLTVASLISFSGLAKPPTESYVGWGLIFWSMSHVTGIAKSPTASYFGWGLIFWSMFHVTGIAKPPTESNFGWGLSSEVSIIFREGQTSNWDLRLRLLKVAPLISCFGTGQTPNGELCWLGVNLLKYVSCYGNCQISNGELLWLGVNLLKYVSCYGNCQTPNGEQLWLGVIFWSKYQVSGIAKPPTESYVGWGLYEIRNVKSPTPTNIFICWGFPFSYAAIDSSIYKLTFCRLGKKGPLASWAFELSEDGGKVATTALLMQSKKRTHCWLMSSTSGICPSSQPSVVGP